MKVYLNEITGIADAFVSMTMSKRTWSREKEKDIRFMCNNVLHKNGYYPGDDMSPDRKNLDDNFVEYEKYMRTLVKWGWQHITMLRFIDFSITVEGLHRAGQDDWDAHACRFHNRIIRSSTRLATFGNEMSEWYQDKIISTDVALGMMGMSVPESLEHNGVKYIKTINGYIREDMKDDKDVKRGLYMLSIPSNFIFKINLTDWAHVYKERNKNGSANPEVKLCCEAIADQIESFQPMLNRELFEKIKC